MEEKLFKIFSNINNWLKYAEAKNGVLLVLNGSALMGIFSQLKGTPTIFSTILKWLITPCFGLSLLILLISFLPIYNKFFKRKIELSISKLSEINLLFFGDLKSITPEVFLRLFYDSQKNKLPTSFPKLEIDIANQIVNNSEIASRKFKLFIIAAYIDFFGIILGTVTYVIKVLWFN